MLDWGLMHPGIPRVPIKPGGLSEGYGLKDPHVEAFGNLCNEAMYHADTRTFIPM